MDGGLKEKKTGRQYAGDLHDKVSSNKVDNTGEGVTDFDLDFSILELPGTSDLNFDHYKHKRSLSQRGSIAHRKRPRRATLQPSSEDLLFLDSTEPKTQKSQVEDEPEENLHQSHAGTRAVDDLKSVDGSSHRKLGDGRIPGLLEGLRNSKVFKMPDIETETKGIKSTTSSTFEFTGSNLPSASHEATSSTTDVSSHHAPGENNVLLTVSDTQARSIRETSIRSKNPRAPDKDVIRAGSLRRSSAAFIGSDQQALFESSARSSRRASMGVITAPVTKTSKEQSPSRNPEAPLINASNVRTLKPPEVNKSINYNSHASVSCSEAQPTLNITDNLKNILIKDQKSLGRSTLSSTNKPEPNGAKQTNKNISTDSKLNVQKNPVLIFNTNRKIVNSEKNLDIDSLGSQLEKMATVDAEERSDDSGSSRRIYNTEDHNPSLNDSELSGFSYNIMFKAGESNKPRQVKKSEKVNILLINANPPGEQDIPAPHGEQDIPAPPGEQDIPAPPGEQDIPESASDVSTADELSVDKSYAHISPTYQPRISSVIGVTYTKPPMTSDAPLLRTTSGQGNGNDNGRRLEGISDSTRTPRSSPIPGPLVVATPGSDSVNFLLTDTGSRQRRNPSDECEEYTLEDGLYKTSLSLQLGGNLKNTLNTSDTQPGILPEMKFTIRMPSKGGSDKRQEANNVK